MTNHPTYPETRYKNLGEGSKIENMTCIIQCIKACLMFTFKSNFFIRTILDDEHIILFSNFQDFLSSEIRYCNTCWILKIRNDINKFRTFVISFQFSKRFFNFIRAHSMFIKRNSNHICLISIESSKTSQIRGKSNQHFVSGINENLSQKV